jgi:uncharacterized protein (TIGR02996 family)
MYSDAAFLKSIQAYPDDDAPRLVYADWLEEQGETQRAEFIRLQIADCDLARQHELLSLFGTSWAGELFQHVYSYSFRRGFVEEISVEGRMLLSHADRLFDDAPLRLVRVIGARAVLDDLLRIPQLRQIHSLHLTGCGIGDEGASLLARCPMLYHLRTLRLGKNTLSDQAVEALTESPCLGYLQSLALQDNLITDLGAQLLAGDRSRLKNINMLDLSENLIGEVGAEALAKSSDLNLNRLDMSNQFKGWSNGFALVGRPNPIQPPQRRALQQRFSAAACLF